MWLIIQVPQIWSRASLLILKSLINLGDWSFYGYFTIRVANIIGNYLVKFMKYIRCPVDNLT